MSRHSLTAARTNRRLSLPMRIGAAVAIAGALGMAGAAAGEAAAAPAPQFTLPEGVEIPDGVQLPEELQDLLVIPGTVRTVKPVNGVVTSGYGARWGSHHNGVDIANKIGTPISAVTDGTVIDAGPASGYGLWIRIRQDDGTVGTYGHVNEIFVHKGQKVVAGQKIATVGNRGNSTGPHLHYQVNAKSGAPINAQSWLGKRGVSLR